MDNPNNERLAGVVAAEVIDHDGHSTSSGSSGSSDVIGSDGSDDSDSSDSDSNGDNSIDSFNASEVGRELERLVNDDPEITTLDVRSLTIITPPMDWVSLGLDIGKNTHLEEMVIHEMPPEDMTIENYEALFGGMASNRSITDIDILRTDVLGGRIFSHFIPMFERISHLTIETCYLGGESSRLLSEALRSCRSTSLEEVNFDKMIGCREEGILDIIDALHVHTKLEKVSLRGNRIGHRGCHHLLPLIRNDRLITLDLGDNKIRDKGASILATDLGRTLTHLNMENNSLVGAGSMWGDLAKWSCLKSLSLKDNNIGEVAMGVLTRSLVTNTTLTDLCLNNTGLNYVGLRAISVFLEDEQSRLAHLSLRYNHIKNKGAILLADSLSNNQVLSRLDVDNAGITLKGWEAFSRILSRGPTIMDTYKSNNALQTLLVDEWCMPGKLMLLLLMNRDGDKREVARQKIVKRHFHGNFDMQPFFDLKVGLFPHVIAWTGRNDISLLYRFIRNMQSFFNFSNGEKVDDGDSASSGRENRPSPAPVRVAGAKRSMDTAFAQEVVSGTSTRGQSTRATIRRLPREGVHFLE